MFSKKATPVIQNIRSFCGIEVGKEYKICNTHISFKTTEDALLSLSHGSLIFLNKFSQISLQKRYKYATSQIGSLKNILWKEKQKCTSIIIYIPTVCLLHMHCGLLLQQISLYDAYLFFVFTASLSLNKNIRTQTQRFCTKMDWIIFTAFYFRTHKKTVRSDHTSTQRWEKPVLMLFWHLNAALSPPCTFEFLSYFYRHLAVEIYIYIIRKKQWNIDIHFSIARCLPLRLVPLWSMCQCSVLV